MAQNAINLVWHNTQSVGCSAQLFGAAEAAHRDRCLLHCLYVRGFALLFSFCESEAASL
jgi:hypothetical protein